MQQKNSSQTEIVLASSRYHNNKTLKQVQGDVTGGFTLIEVLVVVLIIGVLAAVALPQYQKAVLKSRYSAMMPIGKSLADANEVYYLEHGIYAENPIDLSSQGKANDSAYPDGTKVHLNDDNGYSYVQVANDNIANANYLVFQRHSDNFAGNIYCEAADTKTEWLCEEGLNGTIQGFSLTPSYKLYLLSGDGAGNPPQKTMSQRLAAAFANDTEVCAQIKGTGATCTQAEILEQRIGNWYDMWEIVSERVLECKALKGSRCQFSEVDWSEITDVNGNQISTGKSSWDMGNGWTMSYQDGYGWPLYLKYQYGGTYHMEMMVIGQSGRIATRGNVNHPQGLAVLRSYYGDNPDFLDSTYSSGAWVYFETEFD